MEHANRDIMNAYIDIWEGLSTTYKMELLEGVHKKDTTDEDTRLKGPNSNSSPENQAGEINPTNRK